MSQRAFIFFLWILSINRIAILSVQSDTVCHSPQYLNIGELGTINCNFNDDDVYDVLWYNTTDYVENSPILHYGNSLKTGPGYESGEYDVHPNGSLIIRNVTFQHDRTFKVALVYPDEDEPSLIDVRTVVIMKPTVPYPVWDQCDNGKTLCYSELKIPFTIQCSINKVRPVVSLHLVAITVAGDKNISNEMSITTQGEGYTCRTFTRGTFRYSPLLVLLKCIASSPPGMLQKKESMILAQNGERDLPLKEVFQSYIVQNSRMELNCTVNGAVFLVWKKIPRTNSIQRVLAYSVFVEEQFSEISSYDVILGGSGSLIIPRVTVKHRGIYACIYGDGLSDGVIAYDVEVIIHPDPPYPIIDGCTHQQYCVLEAEPEGTLTCTIKGIRPHVQLEWNTNKKSDASLIRFTNQHTTVKDNGETFDVTLTSTYRARDVSRDRLTIECKVSGSNNGFRLSSKMDLQFFEDVTERIQLPTSPGSHLWIYPVIIISILLTFVMSGAIIWKCVWNQNKFKGKDADAEEMSTMLQAKNCEDESFKAMKGNFLKQLREKYKDLYDAVQPIPYIKDRLYCVDRVFVEGGIEFLDSSRTEVKGKWTTLDSYQNVFNDPRIKSTRRILEGEPGYGKSTVTLQFAYDWCNSTKVSALRDFDILIVLRLRQLGGVPSIYRAIKQFILPKDSRLTEMDVESILLESPSVAIILDGFDEYPDQDSSISDFINIIARQMFQEFEVVVTTRSSFLPKKYPPLTKRVRLTGFDDNARRYYIRKAVVGDDEESVQKIEGYLQENPILSDLCQVPLLFVIFAHMTYESEHFRKLNSVTSFFRYMISCFHSHMRNKMEDKNVSKYELFQTNHGDLDKVAFEAFSGKSQKIVWKKDDICHQLGQEFYDQYIRIGILVEEEVIDIIDDPGTPITEHVQYKTEVRFYHKLFCEWYAAHYLSDYIQQNPNVDLSEYLCHLDPFDVQYLYRFSCGLNANSSEKILDYLKNIEGGDKFAILCILEQTGKVDNIRETIRQLCFEGVIISGHDSLLLQRSSMQLIEIAARNDIPIRLVSLHNCLQSVDLSTSAIRTTSGLVLTARIHVKELLVGLYNREMTEDEYIDILEFSSMCSSLRYLTFDSSAPPRSFKVGPALSTLFSRDVTVRYRGVLKTSPKHILNLLTGRWEREDDGLDCTEEDFDRMVKKTRERLRVWAEEKQNKR